MNEVTKSKELLRSSKAKVLSLERENAELMESRKFRRSRKGVKRGIFATRWFRFQSRSCKRWEGNREY